MATLKPGIGNFPRASKYNPDWVKSGVSGGANPLWITEWLAEKLDLRPGMRVLDLGCGRAMSSIFLHREWGVQVWATDLWFSATENWQRIRDAGAAEGVFPVHADARALPYANEFFDAVVCIDCLPYFGTDDTYLAYLARLVKPDGWLAMAGAAFTQEFEEVPSHLAGWWSHDLWCLHSAEWWRRHWERSGIVRVEAADTMTDGWRAWLDWQLLVAPDNGAEIDALRADAGRYLGYVRTVARRLADARLEDPIVSVPSQYTPAPLLSGSF